MDRYDIDGYGQIWMDINGYGQMDKYRYGWIDMYNNYRHMQLYMNVDLWI